MSGVMPGSGGVRSPAGRSVWTLIAAAILVFQGFTTLIYAGFLPPPISDAGVQIPLLGHVPFVWLASGIIALFAAVGVGRRRTWGRYLGTIWVAISAAGTLLSPTMTVIALILPAIVLFALWRRWPRAAPPPSAPGPPPAP